MKRVKCACECKCVCGIVYVVVCNTNNEINNKSRHFYRLLCALLFYEIMFASFARSCVVFCCSLLCEKGKTIKEKQNNRERRQWEWHRQISSVVVAFLVVAFSFFTVYSFSGYVSVAQALFCGTENVALLFLYVRSSISFLNHNFSFLIIPRVCVRLVFFVYIFHFACLTRRKTRRVGIFDEYTFYEYVPTMRQTCMLQWD